MAMTAADEMWEIRKAATGAAIRARRKELGLSQTTLAARLRQKQSVISQWERGAVLPDARNQLALARVLEIDHANLFAALFGDEVSA